MTSQVRVLMTAHIAGENCACQAREARRTARPTGKSVRCSPRCIALLRRKAGEKPPARDIEFREAHQGGCRVQDVTANILFFRFYGIFPPTPIRHEGRTRRYDCGAECGGRECALRRAARSRTAKSCGPGAPMQALSWRQCLRIAPMTVANAGSPGSTYEP